MAPDAGFFGNKVVEGILHFWICWDQQQQLSHTKSNPATNKHTYEQWCLRSCHSHCDILIFTSYLYIYTKIKTINLGIIYLSSACHRHVNIFPCFFSVPVLKWQQEGLISWLFQAWEIIFYFPWLFQVPGPRFKKSSVMGGKKSKSIQLCMPW